MWNGCVLFLFSLSDGCDGNICLSLFTSVNYWTGWSSCMLCSNLNFFSCFPVSQFFLIYGRRMFRQVWRACTSELYVRFWAFFCLCVHIADSAWSLHPGIRSEPSGRLPPPFFFFPSRDYCDDFVWCLLHSGQNKLLCFLKVDHERVQCNCSGIYFYVCIYTYIYILTLLLLLAVNIISLHCLLFFSRLSWRFRRSCCLCKLDAIL